MLDKNRAKTNIDELPGQKAEVIETIDNAKGSGTVRLRGVEWMARSVDDTVIEEGKVVHLSTEKREYILSKQLLRSATSIGANVHEANNAHGKKDFVAKMYIAYKEATETEYWIRLLTETEYFTKAEGSSLLADCVELKQILTAILKSAKGSA